MFLKASRFQMGQGYADTLQPGAGPMQEFLNNVQMHGRNREQQWHMGDFSQGNEGNEMTNSHQNSVENDAASEEDKVCFHGVEFSIISYQMR